MNSLMIRQYQTGDAEAMYALDCVCFDDVFRFSRRSMRRFAEAQGAVSLLAFSDEDQLAGFVIVHVEGPSQYGYVVTLNVAPEHRRTSLATRLMHEAEQRLSAEVIALHVFVKNEAAIRFYERAGYARVGMETGFYGPGLDAWVYSKAL